MSKHTKVLFEYGNEVEVSNRESLESLLQQYWKQNRDAFVQGDTSEDEANQEEGKQPFLAFDGNKVKAKNYIGFIQDGESCIEIYPKVFKTSVKSPADISPTQKKCILQQIFYWFSYCHTWKLPFVRSALDTMDIDSFPELVIYLMAQQLHHAIHEEPYCMYQEVEESLFYPRGRIQFDSYVQQNLARADFHHLPCRYAPFIYDNQINQLVRCCTKILLQTTAMEESQRLLQEILFVLDEVSDVSFTPETATAIKINPFFDSYVHILQTCILILHRQLYSHSADDMSQWVLLFPMECIFEEYMAGFLQQHFSEQWKVEYHKSDMYLATLQDNQDNKSAFKMQHDIFLTRKEKSEATKEKIIVDTKYKIRTDITKDNKRGVVQNDMYQMLSYAYRRGVNKVLLVYPGVVEEGSTENLPTDHFIIPNSDNTNSDNEKAIHVTACNLPFGQMLAPQTDADTQAQEFTKEHQDTQDECLKNALSVLLET